MPADNEPLVNLDEIARLLESHDGPPDARRRRAAPPSRSGLKLTGAVAAGALVTGSGLGFGLGSSLTSSESARAAAVGTGFLPARGWTVVQSGTASGAARAIAANVPLDTRDELGETPRRTLESLPERGIVIVATFTTRGDAGADVAFPVQSLPLQLSAAEKNPGEYRLRAGIKGTNVDARIFFGAAQPSAHMLAATKRQLSRLSVGAEQVTIFARPTIVSSQSPWTTLFGSIESGKSGEAVTIQAKDCGTSVFRVVDGATTTDEGGWLTQYSPGVNTTLRAVWNGRASNQVSVRQRPWVYLDQRTRTTFRVGAGSPPRGGMAGGIQSSFYGKKVLFQRRTRGGWVTVKQIRLTSYPTDFRASLPKGTLVRAVLPLSEARPCFLDGVSFTLRA